MAGAGFKTFNTGDVLTASDVNTYLMQQTVMVFASAAARTTALGANVAEGMLSYLKDTDVVEVYNGSAWVSSDDPNAIQNTIFDAKGDLISATAADTPARLAVGTNGQVLTADSSTSTGLKWATASSGGGVTLITDVQLSGSTGYDFSSIPGTYKNLVLTFSGIVASTTGSNFGLRFNSSSSSIYDNYLQYQETSGNATLSSSADAQVDDSFFGNQGSNTSSQLTARGYITIYDYASTNRTKFYQANIAFYSNNNARNNFRTIIGNFKTTTAITSLNIVRLGGTATLSNQTDTSIRLYGVS